VLALIDGVIALRKDPSNAMVLSVLLTPYFIDELAAAKPGDAQNLILDWIDPIVVQLRVPRRDAERMRQLLLTLRRTALARSRGTRPELLGAKDFIDDCIMLYELTERALGRDGGGLVAPPQDGAAGDSSAAEPGEDADAGETATPMIRTSRASAAAAAVVAVASAVPSDGSRGTRPWRAASLMWSRTGRRRLARALRRRRPLRLRVPPPPRRRHLLPRAGPAPAR